VVSPEITVRYPLDPNRPEGLPLRQANYRILVDNTEAPRLLDVLCSCELAKPHAFYVPTSLAADNRSKLLNAHGIPFHRKNKLDNFYNVSGATFILEGPMTARMRIKAEPSLEAVQVEVRNLFPDPEPRLYRFAPEEFNEDTLEKMGKFMLRQIPHLSETNVDEAYRAGLRRKLRHDRMAKQQELARAHEEREAELAAEEAARLHNRARGKLAELAGRLTVRVRQLVAKRERDNPDG
jgi:hypothetical protein